MSLNPGLDPMANPATLCLSVPILLLFAFLGYVALAFLKDQTEERQKRERVNEALGSLGVDRMRQGEFRRFAAALLQQQGYQARIPAVDAGDQTGAERDLGTDLIASKDGRLYAVFAIRYDKPLSPGTISRAIENRSRYACDVAMVITNATFRSDARRMAEAMGCALVERETLAKWIAQRPDR
jgi:HJR/Mrr/RecB family endonuclease